MEDSIFGRDQLLSYVERRFFCGNPLPENIDKIELFNGVLPSQLEEIIRARTGGKIIVSQQNRRREPMYFCEGNLYIPQYRGLYRCFQYNKMIVAYIKAIEREIEFEAHILDDGDYRGKYSYKRFALEFVTKIADTWDVGRITDIVFGPLNAVAKKAEVTSVYQSEYLDAQLLDVDGKPVLNIDYAFGDQIGLLLRIIGGIFSSEFAKDIRSKDFNVFFFGRVGGLLENMKRHDMVYPTRVFHHIHIEKEKTKFARLPFGNILDSGDGHTGVILNVNTVMGETVELLQKAKSTGCIAVEMELVEIVYGRNAFAYRNFFRRNINIGFVGHVSDLPLQGDTLATELDSDLGEQRAVRKIIEYIRNH